MDEIGFLQDLLAIPSLSGEEDALAVHLVETMAGLGFDAGRDEVGNVIGAVGRAGAERTVVLLGHMDTVPGHIPVRLAGDRLYGRGAVDAKGPLAAFVLAAARVAPRLASTRLASTRLLVIGAVEEEAQSRGALHLARTLDPPTWAIIGEPSDWQGITLGYKGVLSLGYRLVQPNGHTAGAEPGPAEEAVRVWNELAAYAGEYNQGRTGRFDRIEPALHTVRTFGDGLQQGVEMGITVRLPPGVLAADLEPHLRRWCDSADLTVRQSAPAYSSEKNTPLVRALLRAIRAGGGRPRFKLKTGTADMNVVGPVWNCPMVAYGAGDSALDHTPDEHINIIEFQRSIDVLVAALETLAS
jgi:LysW-gamma-L-lysine carboxypeptidase